MSKKAKIASRKKEREIPPEEMLRKIVVVSDGHKVSPANWTLGKTDCGTWRLGWRYGTEEDVICRECKDGH